MENRIGHIDGLRGLAILSVLLYHAFARWPALTTLPYGNHYAHAFGWGWLGVELFFIISGFVITLTLDKCSTFREFMWRRWLRLFPAMLIVTLVIFATAPLMARPFGAPSLAQALPGLLFIDNKWFALINGPDSLEGAFWSLYVEMKFYVFIGLAYFWLGRRWAIAGLIGGFLAYWATWPLHLEGPRYILYMYDVPYWAWFACGVLFYESMRADSRPLFATAFLVGAAASAAPVPGVDDIPNLTFFPFIGLPCVILFGAALTNRAVQKVFSSKALLILGFVSYPLYLIHEQAMIGMTQQLARWLPWVPAALTPIAPIMILVGVAWLIARYGERPVKGLILSLARMFRSPVVLRRRNA